jgi:hypothetical protein
MNTADRDSALHSSALPSGAALQRGVPATAQRTRLAGVLLVIACLLAATGAVLPWLTMINVNLESGVTSQLFTWHVWSTECGWLFPLLVIVLFQLLRVGLSAIRGLPLSLERRRAVLLSLVGLVGTVIFGALMGVVAGYVTLAPGWGRCCRTDFIIEGGFPVSLVSWVLAMIASLLLPAKGGR